MARTAEKGTWDSAAVLDHDAVMEELLRADVEGGASLPANARPIQVAVTTMSP